MLMFRKKSFIPMNKHIKKNGAICFLALSLISITPLTAYAAIQNQAPLQQEDTALSEDNFGNDAAQSDIQKPQLVQNVATDNSEQQNDVITNAAAAENTPNEMQNEANMMQKMPQNDTKNDQNEAINDQNFAGQAQPEDAMTAEQQQNNG